MQMQILSSILPLLGMTMLQAPGVLGGIQTITTPNPPLVPGNNMSIIWQLDSTPNPAGASVELINTVTNQVIPISKAVDIPKGGLEWAMPTTLSEGDYYLRMTSPGSSPKFTGFFHINNADGTRSASASPDPSAPIGNSASPAAPKRDAFSPSPPSLLLSTLPIAPSVLSL
ncbi:hypothetical protein BJ684DRAFT_17650 [Piptocephalis cylindrospora]|uniref:Ser-Thr-rich glycosyl-phosphatidyl-inositol-anchored membrane family-domain-containing protein n=1 Tax=Piptocephalis cylindrospora TaxID=1907219 RepID=A0A4P9XZ89_9FUNG|nr:hypothetical protein BJ684DRAFT_17650 [Piptocephalis cylindrospora]|eukprot:RKP11796.1 hypothetical protein BJ684DRAFT_17650 [Piptocephalis cylindrospora]